MGCGSGACSTGGSCGSGGACGSGGSCGAGGCGSGSWDGTLRDVVGVKFNNTAKTYYHDSTGFQLSKSDCLIVEGEHGEEFARVVQATGPSRKFAMVAGLRKVLRIATPLDVAWNDENLKRQNDAFDFCQSRVRQRRLEMKLVYAEESFDRKKLTFYFTAEGRVDFRELVKELAQQFRSRIEMRQIGPRDEAKVLGGYGICGRPLCCTTFLKEFSPVSIRMAKRQGLSLNPSKISGRCGRLMCCLKYEDTGEDAPVHPPRGSAGPEAEPPAA
ncbi:MAG TPA: stage 0 sporulation family protein [Patescibacteria group bacterium]|jgi:cell fate regulator YaaT (PSP1 superfamily)|nr:stage 0 sporulation family protein [Patescibacteria group bacterium]